MYFSNLFTISILHDFHLNNGSVIFNDMAPNEKVKQLDLYSLNSFLLIEPTESTYLKLKNQRFIFRLESNKLRVGVDSTPLQNTNSALPNKPIIPINEELELTFILKFRHPDFINYTDLGFSPKKLLLLTNEKFDPTSTIPVLQNSPLTNPNDAYITDDFFMDSITQAEITKNLDASELFKAFGIIRIKMVNHDFPDKSVIIDKDKIYNPAHEFIIHFKNKELYWVYQKVSDQMKYRTTNKQPLVKHGFININPETGLTPALTISSGLKLPNPIALNLEKIEVNSVEELSTVIYI